MRNKQLIIFNSFDYGSTGILCNYLKCNYPDNFKSPIFVCSNKAKNHYADYYLYDHTSKIYRKIESTKAALYNSYGFVGKRASNNIIKSLKENISENDKLIISVHQIESSLFDLETIISFAKKYNAKIYFTLHDCWLFTGKCPYYDISKCNKWKTECDVCPCRKEFPFTYKKNLKKSFERKIQLILDNKDLITLVCPSNWMREQLKESKLNQINCVVIHNGIELCQPKNDIGLSNKIGLIAAAFPWVERKGLKYLKYLSNHLDYNKYSLTVVGADSSEGFSNNTIIYPTMSREELFIELSKNDYFLNPTLEDNFPTINLEALSQGLKVVSFITGGSCESFDDNTGYSVDTNEEEFLKTVNTLKKNVEKSACIDRVSKHFTKDIFISKYYNLFDYED